MRSGITAIDDHYDNINEETEIENLRYTTEFRRLLSQIQKFWAAKKFPSCEKKYVMNILRTLTRNAKFNSTSEKLVDQLEEYFKYIQQFVKIENQLKNLINQRYCNYHQLAQCSANYKDLRTFEVVATKIILTLRE